MHEASMCDVLHSQSPIIIAFPAVSPEEWTSCSCVSSENVILAPAHSISSFPPVSQLAAELARLAPVALPLPPTHVFTEAALAGLEARRRAASAGERRRVAGGADRSSRPAKGQDHADNRKGFLHYKVQLHIHT